MEGVVPVLALVLLQAAASAATPAPAPAAPWTVTHGGAGGRGYASVSATEPGGARLAVRCDRAGEPVVSIQFLPRARLRTFGVQPVTLQVDGATPLTDNWELLGGGAIERVDAAVTTLAAAIAHARAIKMRSFDAAGQPIDLAFTGPSSDAPIREVLGACGFTLGQLPARAAPTPVPSPAATPDGG